MKHKVLPALISFIITLLLFAIPTHAANDSKTSETTLVSHAERIAEIEEEISAKYTIDKLSNNSNLFVKYFSLSEELFNLYSEEMQYNKDKLVSSFDVSSEARSNIEQYATKINTSMRKLNSYEVQIRNRAKTIIEKYSETIFHYDGDIPTKSKDAVALLNQLVGDSSKSLATLFNKDYKQDIEDFNSFIATTKTQIEKENNTLISIEKSLNNYIVKLQNNNKALVGYKDKIEEISKKLVEKFDADTAFFTDKKFSGLSGYKKIRDYKFMIDKMFEKNKYFMENLENPYEGDITYFSYPLALDTLYMSSGYGYRDLSIANPWHGGVDLCLTGGTYGAKVLAAESGTVIYTGYMSGGYGNYIIIQHDEHFTTVYGHNSKLLVSKGDKVQKGDVIALAGATGLATGPHVHFEVRYDGVKQNPTEFVKESIPRY